METGGSEPGTSVISRSSSDAAMYAKTTGGVVTANNNMNSKVNKQFNTLPENLQLNGITPSGKPRLFVCKVCTRAFARQEHLTRHERSHTKEKPYVCGICDRRFTRRDLLIRHAQKLHGGNCGDTIRQTSRKRKSVSSGSRRSGGVHGGMNSEKNGVNGKILVGGKNGSEVLTENKVRKKSVAAGELPTNAANLTYMANMQGKKNGYGFGTNSGDKRKNLHRRVSFSAQSGENYAVLPASTVCMNQKPERVDFSTPQVLPLDLLDTVPQLEEPTDFNLMDRNNWINDFNNTGLVGGTDDGNDSSPNSNNTRHSSWEVQGDTLKINSLFSFPMSNTENNQSTQWKTLASSLKPERAGDTMNVSPISKSRDNSTIISNRTEQITSSLNEFGLNFDERKDLIKDGAVFGGMQNFSLDQKAGNSPETRAGSEIANEFKISSSAFGNSVAPFSTHGIHDNQSGEGNNKTFSGKKNKFNDIYDTASNGDRDGKNIAYLFGAEDTCNRIDSSQLQSIMDPGYTFYGIQYPQQCNISKASPIEENLHIQFFNDDIRTACDLALEHYAKICGPEYKPCKLSCSNDELNTYLKLYMLRFHVHYPFIHRSVWTSHPEKYRSYVYEQDAQKIPNSFDQSIYYANIICLPLFAATIGSLYKNTSQSALSKTKELYEISRRVLHVYLDRRKNLKKIEGNISLNSNIWLIQSLTLSVMYSIFAEHSSGVSKSEQILKQVGAVCSLLRSYFFPTVHYEPKDFDSDASVIIWESKLRTTFMMYNLCQFLKTFQRLSSSSFISNTDLQSLMIPSNETRWSNLHLDWLTKTDSDNLYRSNFLNFFQSFQFNDVGYHSIPEFLANSILFYEFTEKLAGSNCNVFINKIDTKKLEKNLPQPDDHLSSTTCLIGDATNLKNSLISLRLFDELDPNFFQIISRYGLTDDLFESCLSPIHANILSKNSPSLIIDLLVSLNVSIKNIASLFYFTNETGYYKEIKFDYSKTSMFQIQGYFFNFLCILKFILDFESTPNFKLLSIFAQLRKLIEQLMIPKLVNNYPLELARFADVQLGSNNNSDTFNVGQLEKTIETVLVQSFNDYNFLKMPPSSSNSAKNEFDFNIPFSVSNNSMASKSSINLLQHHESCKRNGSRVRQGFHDRYHLSDKLLQVAKCSFLLIYESHVHGSLLSHFIENIRILQSKLEDQRKITSIIIDQGNLFGNDIGNNTNESHALESLLNSDYSNVPPGDYYFNPNSL